MSFLPKRSAVPIRTKPLAFAPINESHRRVTYKTMRIDLLFENNASIFLLALSHFTVDPI